jgi:hypothetical protein
MRILFSWLSKLLAGILVATLFSAVFAIVLNQTVLSSHYLEGQLAANNSYNKLSDAITAEFVKNANPSTPQMAATVRSIVTPAVLQVKISSALDQLEAYYKGNGAAPTIDVSDLIAQAQAAGVPVPKDNSLNKPIVLAGNTQAKGISKKFENVKLGTILASLVLIVALLALSWERHKFAVLPDIAIALGILLGIFALAFRLAPGVADKHIKFDFSSNAFASTGHDLATSIAHDLGKRFGIIAIALLVVGIVSRVLVARMKPKAPLPARPRPTAQRAR